MKYDGVDFSSRVEVEGEAPTVSNIFPETTDDERDPREDQNEDRRREEEIKGDRPPHHGG